MRWSRRARSCAALAAAVATTLTCAEARGDDHSDSGFFGLQAYATTWQKPPSLLIQGDGAPARIAGLASPPGGFTSAGIGGDVTARIDGLLLQILQLRYSEALGPSRSGVDTADRSPFQVSAGPMHLFELGSPILGVSGAGGQVVGEHFKLRLFGDWGVAWAWSSATVRDPGGSVWHSSMTSQSLFLRAEADACVRIGRSWPSEASSWACATAASNLYEFDWLSGTSLGVRVDL